MDALPLPLPTDQPAAQAVVAVTTALLAGEEGLAHALAAGDPGLGLAAARCFAAALQALAEREGLEVTELVRRFGLAVAG